MTPSTCLYIAKVLAMLSSGFVMEGVTLAVLNISDGMTRRLSIGLAICIFGALQCLIFGSLFAIIAELKKDQGETDGI